MNTISKIFIIIWLISGSLGCYIDFFHSELSYRDYKGKYFELICVIIIIIIASASGFQGLYIGIKSYRDNNKFP